MPLANCSRCGKTFNKTPSAKLCAACEQLQEEEFERVYRYLRDNPGNSVAQIVQDTDVAYRLVLEWFRTNRLFSKKGDIEWPCERCDAPVNSGRFCRSCADKMQSKLNEAVTDTAPDRTLDQPTGHRTNIGHELRSDKYTR